MLVQSLLFLDAGWHLMPSSHYRIAALIFHLPTVSGDRRQKPPDPRQPGIRWALANWSINLKACFPDKKNLVWTILGFLLVIDLVMCDLLSLISHVVCNNVKIPDDKTESCAE